MEPRLLDWNDGYSWLVMPDYLARIKRFCPAYDEEVDPNALASAVAQDFTKSDEHRVWCMGVLMHEEQIVGHMLSLADGRFLRVWQMELDEGAALTDEVRKEFDGMLYAWAKKHGCDTAETYVADETHERRVRMYYGYKRDKIRMRRKLT